VTPRGRVHRELRLRVDALHRQHEKVAPAVFAAEVDAQKTLHADLTDAPPLTLAFEVAQEFDRRRCHRAIHDKMLEQVRGWAMVNGKWAFGRDPNIRVCAAFAVEMAQHQAVRSLPYDSTPPDCLVHGEPYADCFDALQNARVFQPMDPDWPSPLTRPDRDRVGRLSVDWEQVQAERLASASWTPQQPKSGYSCDLMRPPEAALALLKLVVPTPSQIGLCPDKFPAVLLVGAGWCAAAQVLSMLLPLHRVYHLPMPFADKVQPAGIKWDAVVINVPSAHHWAVARASAKPGELPARVHQAILQGHLTLRDNQHVEAIVQAAAKHLQPGCFVTVMADHDTYGLTLEAMHRVAQLAPALVHGIDTSKQPIWAGYDERPWAPHGFPRPSGRLVSFWKVAP
jgi:hypothetical protein